MDKIKHFVESDLGKDILTVFIVILVGLGSFELGRLSKGGSSQGLKVEYTNENGKVQEQPANVIQAVSSAPKAQASANASYFASSKGSKYYSIGCSAGKTIKLENRVYFKTGEEAQAAGYTLSSSCR